LAEQKKNNKTTCKNKFLLAGMTCQAALECRNNYPFTYH